MEKDVFSVVKTLFNEGMKYSEIINAFPKKHHRDVHSLYWNLKGDQNWEAGEDVGKSVSKK